MDYIHAFLSEASSRSQHVCEQQWLWWDCIYAQARWVFAGRQCDKYIFFMCWLVSPFTFAFYMLYLFRHSMHNMESVFPIMRLHFLHIKDSGLCICIAVCELRRANTGLETAAVVSEVFILSEKDTKFYYLKAQITTRVRICTVTQRETAKTILVRLITKTYIII